MVEKRALLSIDYNLDAVLVYYFVEFRWSIYVFEVIGKSSATFVAYSYADELWHQATHKDSQMFNVQQRGEPVQALWLLGL